MYLKINSIIYNLTLSVLTAIQRLLTWVDKLRIRQRTYAVVTSINAVYNLLSLSLFINNMLGYKSYWFLDSIKSFLFKMSFFSKSSKTKHMFRYCFFLWTNKIKKLFPNCKWCSRNRTCQTEHIRFTYIALWHCLYHNFRSEYLRNWIGLFWRRKKN